MSSGRAERDAQALALHLAGASYAAIAQAVGMSSKASAHAAVQRALANQSSELVLSDDEMRVQMARLDAMLTGLWAKARRGDVAAVDRVLKIEERRTALLTAAQAAAEPAKGDAVDEAADELPGGSAGAPDPDRVGDSNVRPFGRRRPAAG